MSDVEPPYVKLTTNPTWYPNTYVGTIAAPSITKPNLPIWVIPIAGVIVIILVANSRFHNVVIFGLVGIILWWLMNK